jgi:hypothetical protein
MSEVEESGYNMEHISLDTSYEAVILPFCLLYSQEKTNSICYRKHCYKSPLSESRGERRDEKENRRRNYVL